jgi:hypothetical protein
VQCVIHVIMHVMLESLACTSNITLPTDADRQLFFVTLLRQESGAREREREAGNMNFSIAGTLILTVLFRLVSLIFYCRSDACVMCPGKKCLQN